MANCEHSEVEYIRKTYGKNFVFRCLGCNSVGESRREYYVFNRLVDAAEGDRYPVFVRRTMAVRKNE